MTGERGWGGEGECRGEQGRVERAEQATDPAISRPISVAAGRAAPLFAALPAGCLRPVPLSLPPLVQVRGPRRTLRRRPIGGRLPDRPAAPLPPPAPGLGRSKI